MNLRKRIEAEWMWEFPLPFRARIFITPTIPSDEGRQLLTTRRDQFGALRIEIRVLGIEVEYMGPDKSLHDLIGLPKWDRGMRTLVSQFDDEFAELAAAVLQYHAELSYIDHGDATAAMLDLRDRFLEKEPDYTEEEWEVMRSDHAPFEVEETDPKSRYVRVKFPPLSDRERAIHEAYEERQRAWKERQHQARLEFVEMMPRLTW